MADNKIGYKTKESWQILPILWNFRKQTKSKSLVKTDFSDLRDDWIKRKSKPKHNFRPLQLLCELLNKQNTQNEQETQFRVDALNGLNGWIFKILFLQFFFYSGVFTVLGLIKSRPLERAIWETCCKISSLA